jgi:hypothetical protein
VEALAPIYAYAAMREHTQNTDEALSHPDIIENVSALQAGRSEGYEDDPRTDVAGNFAGQKEPQDKGDANKEDANKGDANIGDINIGDMGKGDIGKEEEVKQQVYAHSDRTIEDNGNHLDLLGEEFFGDDNNNNKDNTNANKSTNDMEKVLNIHESIHNINQNLNIGEIQKASQQQSTNLIDFS